MTTPRLRLACLIAGALVLAISLVGIAVTPRACGPDGHLGPVIALEVARSTDDVSRVFGEGECASKLAAALREGTRADQLAFIPAFVAFLSLGALLFGTRDKSIAGLGVASAVLGGLCDEGEDWILLGILDHLPGHGAPFGALFWLVRSKFVLLSLAAGCIGWLAIRSSGKLERVLGILMLIGGVVCALGTLGVAFHRLLVPGTFLAWLSLLIAAATANRDPSRASASPSSDHV